MATSSQASQPAAHDTAAAERCISSSTYPAAASLPIHQRAPATPIAAPADRRSDQVVSAQLLHITTTCAISSLHRGNETHARPRTLIRQAPLWQQHTPATTTRHYRQINVAPDDQHARVRRHCCRQAPPRVYGRTCLQATATQWSSMGQARCSNGGHTGCSRPSMCAVYAACITHPLRRCAWM